jgi:hypothetical protein
MNLEHYRDRDIRKKPQFPIVIFARGFGWRNCMLDDDVKKKKKKKKRKKKKKKTPKKSPKMSVAPSEATRTVMFALCIL